MRRSDIKYIPRILLVSFGAALLPFVATILFLAPAFVGNWAIGILLEKLFPARPGYTLPPTGMVTPEQVATTANPQPDSPQS